MAFLIIVSAHNITKNPRNGKKVRQKKKKVSKYPKHSRSEKS